MWKYMHAHEGELLTDTNEEGRSIFSLLALTKQVYTYTFCFAKKVNSSKPFHCDIYVDSSLLT